MFDLKKSFVERLVYMDSRMIENFSIIVNNNQIKEEKIFSIKAKTGEYSCYCYRNLENERRFILVLDRKTDEIYYVNLKIHPDKLRMGHFVDINFSKKDLQEAKERGNKYGKN